MFVGYTGWGTQGYNVHARPCGGEWRGKHITITSCLLGVLPSHLRLLPWRSLRVLLGPLLRHLWDVGAHVNDIYIYIYTHTHTRIYVYVHARIVSTHT